MASLAGEFKVEDNSYSVLQKSNATSLMLGVLGESGHASKGNFVFLEAFNYCETLVSFPGYLFHYCIVIKQNWKRLSGIAQDKRN